MIYQLLCNPGISLEYLLIIRLDREIVGLAGSMHVCSFCQSADMCTFVLIRVVTEIENPKLLWGMKKRAGQQSFPLPSACPPFQTLYTPHIKRQKGLLCSLHSQTKFLFIHLRQMTIKQACNFTLCKAGMRFSQHHQCFLKLFFNIKHKSSVLDP